MYVRVRMRASTVRRARAKTVLFAYRMRLFHCRPGGQPSFARRASSATTTADAVTARRTAVPLHPACAVGSREKTLTARTVSVVLTRYIESGIPIESGNIRGRARTVITHAATAAAAVHFCFLPSGGDTRARAPGSSAPLSHPPARTTDRPTDPPRTARTRWPSYGGGAPSGGGTDGQRARRKGGGARPGPAVGHGNGLAAAAATPYVTGRRFPRRF